MQDETKNIFRLLSVPFVKKFPPWHDERHESASRQRYFAGESGKFWKLDCEGSGEAEEGNRSEWINNVMYTPKSL